MPSAEFFSFCTQFWLMDDAPHLTRLYTLVYLIGQVDSREIPCIIQSLIFFSGFRRVKKRMACPQCSVPTPKDAKFCPQCGYPLVSFQHDTDSSGNGSRERHRFFMSFGLTAVLTLALVGSFSIVCACRGSFPVASKIWVRRLSVARLAGLFCDMILSR